jgi:hypothetical protein
MAKIRYIAPSPKAGQEEHVRPDTARTLVAAGFAEECKLAPRGTKAWFAQRMEQSSLTSQPSAGDTVAPKLVPGWTIVTRDGPGGQQYFVQEVRASGETFLYDGPPKHCPAPTVKHYQELTSGKVDPAVALEARRIAQCEKQNAAAENKEREQSAFARIFGGR